MPIIPSEAIAQAHKASGNGWKVFTNLCGHRNDLTGQCNPSHKLISAESGVEYCGVSTAKQELRALGWIETRGKRDVIIKIGIAEFERVREKKLAERAAKEKRMFGKSKDGASRAGAIVGKTKDARPDNGSIFGKSKDADGDLWKTQTPSLENPKIHNKDKLSSELNAAAATAGRDAWKEEPVTPEFCDELVTRGLFSQEVVMQSYRELAFKVAQRPPGSTAKKGELMAFCFAKLRTGVLPYQPAEVVAHPGKQSAPVQKAETRDCDHTCALCFGSQIEVVPGRGSRKCPNRIVDQEERVRDAQ